MKEARPSMGVTLIFYIFFIFGSATNMRGMMFEYMFYQLPSIIFCCGLLYHLLIHGAIRLHYEV